MSKEITKRTKIEIAKSPAGLEGPGFFATKAEDVIGLARANSLWPLPFATSCCGIEFMACASSSYDVLRVSVVLVRLSLRQVYFLVVTGTTSYKQAPIFNKIYEQMCETKWVLYMGAFA